MKCLVISVAIGGPEWQARKASHCCSKQHTSWSPSLLVRGAHI